MANLRGDTVVITGLQLHSITYMYIYAGVVWMLCLLCIWVWGVGVLI